MASSVLGLVHLSVLLLSSFTVLAYDELVSVAQAPHHILPGVGHPPAAAPAPHKGGHHHHHHPKHHPSPPPAKSPTPAPPTKAPTPPAKAPTPPAKAPTPPAKPPTPPAKAPTPPAKAPTPPAKAPTPPTKAPTPSPAKPSPPPTYPVPVRKLVAIQGVVYCKSCKYTGVNTLTGATALANATVKLVCANTKYKLVEQAMTDKNGYFFLLPQKVTTAGIRRCKVLLSQSPSAKCSVPTDLHAGRSGALLLPTPSKVPAPSKYALFTVGPFAFEPAKKC